MTQNRGIFAEIRGLGQKYASWGSETGLKRFFRPGFLYKDSFSDTNFSTFRYNRQIMPIFLIVSCKSFGDTGFPPELEFVGKIVVDFDESGGSRQIGAN